MPKQKHTDLIGELSNTGLVTGQDRVVVGFSGGADSLTLLHLLVRLRDRLGLELHAAHLNHQLRGGEADADAQSAIDTACGWQVPCTVGVRDVRSLARGWRVGIEAAARRARYEFLCGVAKEVGALKIAVGHTADDQAETVLMHVLRGAGLSGLAGMRYRVAVPSCQDDQVVLVRPLLQVSRRRIEAYCAAHGLVPRTDASNLDETLFRNRVRHEVLPFLERIRPGVWQSLVQLGELAAADELALEELLAQQWAGLVNQAARGEVTLDRSVWQELPLSLRRRALRRAVYLATAGGGPPDFGQLEAARRQSETGQSGTEVQFADGARLEVRYDRLVFTAVPWGQPVDSLEFPQLEPGIELAVPAPRWDVPLRGWGVPVPGGVALPNSGWRVETQRLSAGEQLLSDARHNTDRWQAYLDADQAGEPVVLRTRRPGERFQPLGLAGRSMLVSDFMVNQRIPRRYRAGMPLLSNAAGQILWIPGYRLAHPVRITTDTRTALRISLRRL